MGRGDDPASDKVEGADPADPYPWCGGGCCVSHEKRLLDFVLRVNDGGASGGTDEKHGEWRLGWRLSLGRSLAAPRAACASSAGAAAGARARPPMRSPQRATKKSRPISNATSVARPTSANAAICQSG